jgi:hypothetical protein
MTPPQSQESLPDSPSLVPQEETFEIENMVPESLEAQDAPTKEPEQQQGEEDEDDDEEHSPLRDLEGKKLYNDTDESEFYRVEALGPIGKLHALLVHLGISTALNYWIKGVLRPRQVEYRAKAEIFSRSRVISRHQGPAF